MTTLGRLLEARGSVEAPSVPLTSGALVDAFGAGTSSAGVAVTEQRVMGLPAYWRGCQVLAGTGGSLPLKVFEGDTRERVKPPLFSQRKPNPTQTWFEMWEQLWLHAVSWGNAYAWILRDKAGGPVGVTPIHPSKMDVALVREDREFHKRFTITGVDGSQSVATDWEVFHVPGMSLDGVKGMSALQAFRTSLGAGIAADEFAAKFFGNGTRLSGILRTKNSLDGVKAARLKRRWKRLVSGPDNAYDIAVLDNDANFEPVSVPPADAELLNSRKWTVSEVGRIVGLPPHMLGDVEKSTSWGSGIEQQGIGFVVYSLRGTWLSRFEQRITADLIVNPNRYAEYAIEGLLRGDSKARAEFYRKMRDMGVVNGNEIRAFENLERVEGLDFYTIPKNMQIIRPGEQLPMED
ncbi:MAG: phage portal protein [Actinomycetia bacterium]|nr:phage portal protein [Actinomycetes bacterium]